MDPYTTFVYGIRSPHTKESYCRRLCGFFDAISVGKGKTLEERCNIFVHKGRADTDWAINNILGFLHYQKERVGKNEITAGTLLIPLRPATKGDTLNFNGFDVEEIEELIKLSKDEGKIHFCLPADPLLYMGIDHLDPIFKETDPLTLASWDPTQFITKN
jgi:hypothetical protein